MPTATLEKKQPAPDFPYTMRFQDGRTLAVEVPGRCVVRDPSGEVCFTPEGVRLLDHLRALFAPLDRTPNPGFIRALRQALGLTQEAFGKRVGVDKLTVSRWERGSLRPGKRSIQAIQRVRSAATKKGVTLPG